jgi:hypothetical protein
MRTVLLALFFAIAVFADGASAQMGRGGGGHAKTAKSGVETQVYLHHGSHEGGISKKTSYKIEQRPANGTARIVVTNLSSGTGKPIRVAQVMYTSKKGFVGSDSFSYQRLNPNGSVDNFTLSVSVVP